VASGVVHPIRWMCTHPADLDAAPVDEHLRQTRYVIRVRGVLSDRLLTAFPGLRSRAERGDTVLAGTLPDQSALHGVLAQIEALGLELLEVRRSRR
jgi:hypothetical protein